MVEYPHSQGCAVTGGYVYRGTQVPAIYAHYVFSDFCSGTVWMIPRGGGPKAAALRYAVLGQLVRGG